MFNNIPPLTKNIIIINVIVYMVSNFFLYALQNQELYNLLSAFYPSSPNFKSWQIVTHMFMHAPLDGGIGIMHILFNMFTLYSFGPILEQSLGGKKYLILYFLSGLGAFALFNLWNFIEIQQIVNSLNDLGINPSEIYRQADVNYSGQILLSNRTPEIFELSEKLLVDLRTPMMGASGGGATVRSWRRRGRPFESSCEAGTPAKEAASSFWYRSNRGVSRRIGLTAERMAHEKPGAGLKEMNRQLWLEEEGREKED
ncbi:MAG: rhomboid family intramembrane serine protease, partial [Chryseobacterium sp.]